VLGIAFLAADFAGLFVPLRSPHLRSLAPPPSGAARLPSVSEVHRALARLPASPPARAVALTGLVHDAIVHDWSDARRDSFHIRLPFAWNWVLGAAARIAPERFGKYEFVDPDRALERGVGPCSQKALALVGVGRRAGHDMRLVGLRGHVVVEDRVGGSGRWTLDPDYGVAVDASVAELAADTARLAGAYAERGYGPATQRWIVAAFRDTPPHPYASVREYTGPVRPLLESAAGPLAWGLPIAFVISALALARPPAREPERRG